ncbi:hypothetical protein [Roseibium sp.]|uniref:hypothetical protein n=1 Tax=Roseibium sp. TaxID=1936156 RepID=UPI001B224952|nr:hypothetical protein [Roseibium sp.]MBO6858346.1 hypothetical protein [Roseibium sp.]
MRHTQKRPVAKGCIDPKRPGQRKVVLVLDDETFEQIRDMAIKDGTSFAEQIRLLVEWGLEAERAEA